MSNPTISEAKGLVLGNTRTNHAADLPNPIVFSNIRSNSTKNLALGKTVANTNNVARLIPMRL